MSSGTADTELKGGETGGKSGTEEHSEPLRKNKAINVLTEDDYFRKNAEVPLFPTCGMIYQRVCVLFLFSGCVLLDALHSRTKIHQAELIAGVCPLLHRHAIMKRRSEKKPSAHGVNLQNSEFLHFTALMRWDCLCAVQRVAASGEGPVFQ